MANARGRLQRVVDRSINTKVIRPDKDALIEEKADLDDRLAELSKYISTEEFYDLDGINQQLMKFQESLMTQYTNTLERRILFFKG